MERPKYELSGLDLFLAIEKVLGEDIDRPVVSFEVERDDVSLSFHVTRRVIDGFLKQFACR